MKILHTEASPGWGGQEFRILCEAEGMRARGYEVVFAIQKGGGLVSAAQQAGFKVYEVQFKKAHFFSICSQLWKIIRRHGIEILNTHSSLDAWIGGVIGKFSGCCVIRTRHLSTPIRKGLNSRLLYNWLADYVVTTCEDVVNTICTQAALPASRCFSIPTGVDPNKIFVDPQEVSSFRKHLGIQADECIAGTLCVLRGWKGVHDLLHAAKLLEHVPKLKWIVIGGGVSEDVFLKEREKLGLEQKVLFTGALYPPYTALAALDIFLLLSWAHEGVSQASLQAAWLEKPLVTTPTGGLKEVCIEGKTGLQVPIRSPRAVAAAVEKLYSSPHVRYVFGQQAKALVQEKFLFSKTLDDMEKLYSRIR